MKRLLLLLSGVAFLVSGVAAQVITVKSNLLYDATSTINLGTEFSIAPRITIDLSANYNPWEFSGEKRLKHWMIQPEVRFWFYRKFDGHFLGAHGVYGDYDLNKFSLLGLKDFGYDGNMYGGGISYGYQWLLNSRLSIEASVGVGYIHMEYDKYDYKVEDDSYMGKFANTYYGPTKLGISLIYFFK